MYAFVLIYFDNKIKYIELALYFLLMLKKYTKNDIIFMYSINDTPDNYVKIIQNINVETIGYDDKNITYEINNFKSSYIHFNTLRSCNFIFAYQLIKYKKICIIESDMVITQNIDSVFELKTPSILYYQDGYNKNLNKRELNYKIEFNKNEIKDKINKCSEKSEFNGGILLFKPSKVMYNKFLKSIKIIINNQCKYPNEMLFVYCQNKIYNLPVKYNLSHFYLNNFPIKDKILIYHFNSVIYKPLDIIKDKYIDKISKKKKEIILFFKKNVYDIYFKKINKLLSEN